MKRLRDDSIKSGRGISGAKGENFTKVNDSDSVWGIPNPGGEERRYDRNLGSSRGDQWIERSEQNLLRNKQPLDWAAGSRDLWNDVNSNANGNPEDGFSAAIRYGVNRSQADGTRKSSH
jgi:hypothetical protein